MGIMSDGTLTSSINVDGFLKTTADNNEVKEEPVKQKARIAAKRSYGSGDDGTTVVSNDLTMEKDSIFCEVTGLSDTVSHYLGICYKAVKDAYGLRQLQTITTSGFDADAYEEQLSFLDNVAKTCTRLQNEMNVIAALVYTYAEDERYEPDITLLDSLNVDIDDWAKDVGDGPSFTQWGDGGSLELHLNAIRVHIRTLERAYVSWMRHGALRKHAVYRVKRHLAIVNRSSLWAYWAARKAGNYYRDAAPGVNERFWADPK